MIYRCASRFVELPRIRSVAALRATLEEGMTKKAKEDVLKNQVRIRKFVDWDTERTLPKLTQTVEELQVAVEAMIEAEPEELALSKPPDGMAERAVAINADSARQQIDEIRRRLTRELREEVEALVNSRRFAASAGGGLPPDAMTGVRVTALGQERRGVVGDRAGEGAAALAAEMTAAADAEFAGGEREYKIIQTTWSLEGDTVLCVYYDTGEHGAEDEAAMLEDSSSFERGVYVAKAALVKAWLERRPLVRV